MKREPTIRSAPFFRGKEVLMLLALIAGMLLSQAIPISRAADGPTDLAMTGQQAPTPVPTQAPPGDAPGGPNGDPADPPPHPCVIGAFDISRSCAVELHDMAAACVESIAALFQNGQADEAPQLVETCIGAINQHAQDCLGALRDHCDACMTDLIDEDAPMELIEAVTFACREGAEHILHAKGDAIDAIERAVEHGIAQTCMRAMRRITAGCVEQNAQTAQACVEQIAALLEQGLVGEAVQAAQACQGEIKQQTAECAREIVGRCQDCMERLIHRCADARLILRVRKACEQSLRLLHHSAKRALQQIRDALPPPPDGEDGNVPEVMPAG